MCHFPSSPSTAFPPHVLTLGWHRPPLPHGKTCCVTAMVEHVGPVHPEAHMQFPLFVSQVPAPEQSATVRQARPIMGNRKRAWWKRRAWCEQSMEEEKTANGSFSAYSSPLLLLNHITRNLSFQSEGERAQRALQTNTHTLSLLSVFTSPFSFFLFFLLFLPSPHP